MEILSGLVGVVVGLSLSGSADNATTTSALLGCDTYVVEGTNYTNKVDPTCTFKTEYRSTGVGVGVDGVFGTADDTRISDN